MTCKVLSECSAPGVNPMHVQAEAVAAASGVPLTPLSSLVKSVTPAVEPLIRSVTSGWYMCENKDAALQLLEAFKHPSAHQYPAPGTGHCHAAASGISEAVRVNLVTMQGEVFKADGEIVAKVGRNSNFPSKGRAGTSTLFAQYTRGPYDLSTEPVLPSFNATNSSVDAAKHGAGSRQGRNKKAGVHAFTGSAVCDAAAKVDGLKAACAQATANVISLSQQEAAARRQLGVMRSKLIAAQQLLAATQVKLAAAQTSNGARASEKLAAAKASEEEAASAVSEAQALVKAQQQIVQQLSANLKSLEQQLCSRMQQDAAALHSRLQEKQRELKQAKAAMSKVYHVLCCQVRWSSCC